MAQSPLIADENMAAGFQSEHGSAAVVTTTAASGQRDAHTPAPSAHAAITAANAEQRPTTPPAGPQMAFMSGASTPATPAAVPGRRSPLASLIDKDGFDHRFDPNGVNPRGQCAGRDASRSRSSHSRTRIPSGPRRSSEARGGHVADAIKKLEDTIKGIQKHCADDWKWLADIARRIVGLEGRVREQTKEAMDYSRVKIDDLDARLANTRAELEANIPNMFTVFESKVLGKNGPSALVALASKFQERVDGLEQTIKGLDQTVQAQQHFSEQHQAYLKARVDAKPGEEQTLVSYFKYLKE